MEVAGQALAATTDVAAVSSKKVAPPVYDYFHVVKEGKHVAIARDGTETEFP